MKPEGLLLLCSYSGAFQMFQDAVSQHGFVPIPCFTLQEAESAISERELAVIVCSGQVLDGTYHRLFVGGAAGCMARPVSQSDVEQVLRAVAGHVRGSQQTQRKLV